MAVALNNTGFTVINNDIIATQDEMVKLDRIDINFDNSSNIFDEMNIINETLSRPETKEDSYFNKIESNINVLLNTVASWVTTESSNDGFEIPESFTNEQAQEIIICYNYANN